MRQLFLLNAALALCLSTPAAAQRCEPQSLIDHAETMIKSHVDFSIGYGNAQTISYEEDAPKHRSADGVGGSGWHQFTGAFISENGLQAAEHFRFQSRSICLAGHCAGEPEFDLSGDGSPVVIFFHHQQREKNGVETVKHSIRHSPCRRDVHELKSTLDLARLQYMLENKDAIRKPATDSAIGLGSERPMFTSPHIFQTTLSLNLCQDSGLLGGRASYEIELKEATQQIWLGGAAVDISDVALRYKPETEARPKHTVRGQTPSVTASEEERRLDVRFIDLAEEVPPGAYVLELNYSRNMPKSFANMCAVTPSRSNKFNPKRHEISELIPAFHGEQYTSHYDLTVNLPKRYEVAFNVNSTLLGLQATNRKTRISHSARLSRQPVASSALAMSIGGKTIFGMDRLGAEFMASMFINQQWQYPGHEGVRIGFRKNGSLEGRSWCSSFSGHYQAQETKLKIVRGATTERPCSPQSKRLEEDFFNKLASVTSAVDAGSEMYLFDNKHKSLMWLRNATPLKPTRLYDVSWHHPAFADAYIRFSENGEVTGKTPCNILGGKAIIGADSVQLRTIEMKLVGTQRRCPGVNGVIEDSLYGASKQASFIRESDNGLEFIAEDNAVLLSLQPAFIW